MNIRSLCFAVCVSFFSISLLARNAGAIPDSLIFSGVHFSIHGSIGFAQPAGIHALSGPHKLESSPVLHFNYGFSFSFFKPHKASYTRIGLKVEEWFENYKCDLTKSPANGLLFDELLFERIYIIESYYLFIERGRRVSLGKNFFFSPFVGMGIEGVRLLIGQEDAYQGDSLGNSKHILHIEENNTASSRIRFRIHGGIEAATMLPWQHIVSLRLLASYSPGKFVKGNYILLPGTAEESTGTYDLLGNYLGFELTYSFTGVRKKRFL